MPPEDIRKLRRAGVLKQFGAVGLGWRAEGRADIARQGPTLPPLLVQEATAMRTVLERPSFARSCAPGSEQGVLGLLERRCGVAAR